MPARPKSNREKHLAGTLRNDRIRPELTVETLDSPPDPPDWLVSPEAVREFSDRASDLLASNRLHRALLAPLAHYANHHAAMVKKWRAGMECTASDMTQMRLLAKDLGFVDTGVAAPSASDNAFAGMVRKSG